MFDLFSPLASKEEQQEVCIAHPVQGDRCTPNYKVRFRISSKWQDGKIFLSYKTFPGQRQCLSIPWAEGQNGVFEKVIRNLAPGKNEIILSVGSVHGEMEVRVGFQVISDLHPIISQKNLLTLHQLKHGLKAKNSIAARQYQKLAKTDGYINEFVDCLDHITKTEGISRDVAFSQIMLETGWLTYPQGVLENQNNFGGIGATGGLCRGNAFQSMAEGILVNVQHLLAYASLKEPKSELVDPRFYYVTRASAPTMEELGYYENTKDGGWAMASQYGFVLRDLMDDLMNFGNAPFIPEPSMGQITEIVAQGIEDSANPLDIRPGTSFHRSKFIRCAIASNDWTVQDFQLKNLTNGELRTIQNTLDRAALFWPMGYGEYEFLATIKEPGSSRVIDEKSIQFAIQGGTVAERT